MKNAAATQTLAFLWLIGAMVSQSAVAQDPQPVASEQYSLPTTADGNVADVHVASAAVPCNCPKCKAAGKTRKTCCCGECIDWSKVPASYRIFPRPGNFPIPPTGCGYYSLADQLTGTCRPKHPKTGYAPFALMAPSFYEANFNYVESMDLCDQTLVEKLKHIPVTDCVTFSTGGQFWARYMQERNSRLSPNNNDYTLSRVRLFGDLSYGENIRIFGEFIWADSFGEELAPLPIDVNRGDILNLFADLRLFDYEGKPVFARVGRQELLLGSQRLVSTLDWANTRRTFDGARLFRQGDKWDFDLFFTKFVPAQATEFDTADNNRNFAGAWITHRPQKGHFADFYYLYADNKNNVTRRGIVQAPNETHTIGTRYAGDKNGILYEAEGALQFGKQGAQDLFAGMASAGLGRRMKQLPFNATGWVYYDYASGGSNGATSNTFNQLYPFGHYYLGWADQVGRQNIHDVNAHLYLYPEKWMTVWLQYHHFWLADAGDALYNAGGVPARADATGASGRNVGDEIDIVLNFHLTRYSDVMVGYSHLFGGGFLENTAGPSDMSLFHAMYQMKW